MTFLTIMQTVATNAGIEVTTTGSNDADHVKLAQFINEAGQELARRVDWGPLRKITTIAGTGAAVDHPLPADLDRLAMGMNVSYAGSPVRGSLTPDEWMSLAPIKGAPRYYYLSGSKISFYPYLATGSEVRLQYQSKNWVNNGAKAALTIDTDTSLISEDLIAMGATWRWRRHVGKDFSDYLAEFEAVLVDRAKFDSAVRLP